MKDLPERMEEAPQFKNILYRVENLPEPQPLEQRVYPTSRSKFEKRGRK